jgi:hypothetical protein
MPTRYMLIGIVDGVRTIWDHFATHQEAELEMALQNELIDSGEYGDEYESTILLIEEIEIEDTDEEDED